MTSVLQPTNKKAHKHTAAHRKKLTKLFGPVINSGLTSSRKLFPFGPTKTPVVADARWAASPVEVPGPGCLMALFHIDTKINFQLIV